MGFIDTILSIFFPTRCVACGKEGADLCENCLFAFPPAVRECAEWIFPLFDYRHPGIKKTVWSLKYNGRKSIANIFAEAMYGRILEELADLRVMENFHHPLLLPIPLSPRRFRERGFNQAELICKKLTELDKDLNFALEKNVLYKPRETVHQARIENRAERLKNIVDSFKIGDAKTIKGRNIILIDDVTTTGATLNEAKKILKQSGARKIVAFTVAH